jgi:hypothetical protein
MKISVTTPRAVEGNWVIYNAAGDVVVAAKDYPDGVTLVVEPNFYSPMAAQAVASIKTMGKSGKSTRQILQISPRTGRVTAVKVNDAPQAVLPFFDKPSPKSK